jgi:hypothetical protein
MLVFGCEVYTASLPGTGSVKKIGLASRMLQFLNGKYYAMLGTYQVLESQVVTRSVACSGRPQCLKLNLSLLCVRYITDGLTGRGKIPSNGR